MGLEYNQRIRKEDFSKQYNLPDPRAPLSMAAQILLLAPIRQLVQVGP